ALEREAELAACAKPGDEGERPSPDSNEREPEGGAVREILGAGPCLLGFAHELNHLREVGVGTGPPDFAGDRALAIHGAPDESVALALLYQLGLAGQHCLVDARATSDDQPVGRDLLSWLDEHPVARLQGIERDLFDGAVGAEAMRLGREKPDQLVEGARSAEHG